MRRLLATIAVAVPVVLAGLHSTPAYADPELCERLKWSEGHHGPFYISSQGDVWLDMGTYYEKIYDCPPYAV